jgi:hypothetical protein
MTHRTRTHYEWDIEFFNLDGDIIDHYHEDRLADLEVPFAAPTEPDEFKRIVLVRDVCEEYVEGDFTDHDVRNRDHFYPSNTEDDGWQMLDVPKRYAAEFERNKDWASKGDYDDNGSLYIGN